MTHRNGTTSGWWSKLWGNRADEDLAAYRRLAVQLHNELTRTDGNRSLLVVTPTRSPVCAQSSSFLAYSAATELRVRVLLVDGCPRNPETSRLLRCDDRPGFANILAGSKTPWEQQVLPTVHENVSFLPAGDYACKSEAPPVGVDAFLDEAQRSYGIVIVAGGSVLEDSAAPLITPHVGCVLLSVIENETLANDLDAAQDTLSHSRARMVGLLVTTPLRRKTQTFTRIKEIARSQGAT